MKKNKKALLRGRSEVISVFVVAGERRGDRNEVEVKVSEITARRTCEDEENEEKIKPKKCRR
jgi:hypothetical protein